MCFFAVLVRFSVLVAILPFLGDKVIPSPIKVLLSLSLTFALFPSLVARGWVKPGEAIVWGSSAAGIIGVIVMESLLAVVIGFTAKMVFEAIQFGGNLTGSITNSVTYNSDNTITVNPSATNGLTLTVNSTLGTFTGQFVDPTSLATNLLNGVLLQSSTNAAGFFLGTSESGSIILH